MIIKIEYYPDAKDEKDAAASEPLYQGSASSFERAVEFIGKLERIERATVDKAILEAERNGSDIPF